MDSLQLCAQAFASLLNIKYHFLLGRKGKISEFSLCFSETEFHHLIGLHKLHDLHISRENRARVFYDILEGKIPLSNLNKSRYFPIIQKRVDPLTHLEEILDSNRFVFRYNTNRQAFSRIKAEYLLSTPYGNTDIYLFLDQNPNQNWFFCRSFFPKEGKDYTEGQPILTLLQKQKTDCSTGQILLQYSRSII